MSGYRVTVSALLRGVSADAEIIVRQARYAEGWNGSVSVLGTARSAARPN